MKSWVGAGCALTIVPIVAFVLEVTNVVPVEGNHGLGEWFFDSACFAMLLVATIVNAILSRRGARAPLVMAIAGAVGMIAFIAYYGIPFGR